MFYDLTGMKIILTLFKSADDYRDIAYDLNRVCII
ncbi:unnamed protein product [Acanthoscelides obtectus]|uniref:Uncharacterized protein n=1 Tax=Acanthoscelides obtectus TaxID=200917 RepID=A0A9P0QHK7_ACAOB|nr:unnamed protein product [Acanthoscelides obtectus]CAK1682638.1 hypothetical protein AOBTE_LOCUS33751 [Acanthoscelides obtectus]